MHLATVLISLAAAVTAFSQDTPTSVPATPALGCYSAISSFKVATPRPTPQPAFKLYMDSNDPFDRQCLSATIPGISLIERNRCFEEYEKQAKWYNKLHAALEELPAECQASTKKEEEELAAGKEWQLIGIKKGLPKTWDDIERLPKCEDITQEEVKVYVAMSSRVKVGVLLGVAPATVAMAVAF